MVPAQLAFDVLDVLAELDEFAAVFTGSGDQGVEHRDDGLAENAGDALVDAVVEGGDVCGRRVFHRLCARQVLHVKQVRAYLTCDLAVAEEHGDVEDGAARPDGQAGAGLWITALIGTQVEFLKFSQLRAAKHSQPVGFELLPVAVQQVVDDRLGDFEVRRHHRRRHMHPVRQQ